TMRVSAGDVSLSVTRGPVATCWDPPPHATTANGTAMRTRRRTASKASRTPLPGGPAGAVGAAQELAGLAHLQRALAAVGELVAARRRERDADRHREASVTAQCALGLRVRSDREGDLACRRIRARLAADPDELRAPPARKHALRRPDGD